MLRSRLAVDSTPAMECGSGDEEPVALAGVVEFTRSEPFTVDRSVGEVGSVVQRQVGATDGKG